jgi:hypothetical protein
MAVVLKAHDQAADLAVGVELGFNTKQGGDSAGRRIQLSHCRVGWRCSSSRRWCRN